MIRIRERFDQKILPQDFAQKPFVMPPKMQSA
jgi:hypothetical protein